MPTCYKKVNCSLSYTVNEQIHLKLLNLQWLRRYMWNITKTNPLLMAASSQGPCVPFILKLHPCQFTKQFAIAWHAAAVNAASNAQGSVWMCGCMYGLVREPGEEECSACDAGGSWGSFVFKCCSCSRRGCSACLVFLISCSFFSLQNI